MTRNRNVPRRPPRQLLDPGTWGYTALRPEPEQDELPMHRRIDKPKPKGLLEPVVIAEKPAGRQGEVLRIDLSDFKGSPYLSQRKWFRDDAGELRPGKGLTVAVAELPWLVTQLQCAEAEALRIGLLDEESFEAAGRPLPDVLGGEAA